MKNNNTRRGFTLIELLVVVLIIGILAAVALPQYQKAVEKSRAGQAFALLRSIEQAANSYYLSEGKYPTNFDDMEISIPWTGKTKWSTNLLISDTRSNQDWSLQIYANGNWREIYLGRISGPYQGAGFMLPLSRNETTIKAPIICAERRGSGVIFNRPAGDYCEKILNATQKPTYQRYNSYRWYQLP